MILVLVALGWTAACAVWPLVMAYTLAFTLYLLAVATLGLLPWLLVESALGLLESWSMRRWQRRMDREPLIPPAVVVEIKGGKLKLLATATGDAASEATCRTHSNLN